MGQKKKSERESDEHKLLYSHSEFFSIGSVQLHFFITFVSKRIHSKRRKFSERGEVLDTESLMEKPERRRRLW